MRSVRSRLAVVVVAVGIVASACTQKEATSFGEAEDDFVTECAAGSDGTATEQQCSCAYDKIQETMTFDEFKKLDEHLQDNPEDIPDEIVGFIAECKAAGPTLDTTTTTSG